MAFSKILGHTRFLIPVLITSLLVSCSASQHPGVTTINEPPLTEDNESSWFVYYQDQFDANEGNVMPPSTQYPQCAIQSYQRAKLDWDDKVKAAKTKTTLAYIGLGVADVILLYLILTAIFPIHVSGPKAPDL